MEDKGPHHIRDGTDDSFGFAILRRSIWARKSKLDAMSGKVGGEFFIDIFFPIVTLKTLNGPVELSLSIFVKLDKMIKYLRFKLNRKNP